MPQREEHLRRRRRRDTLTVRLVAAVHHDLHRRKPGLSPATRSRSPYQTQPPAETKGCGGEGKGRRWMAGWMGKAKQALSTKQARQGPTTQQRLRRQQERRKRRAPLALAQAMMVGSGRGAMGKDDSAHPGRGS
ncbi:hypothetical protein CORC01_10068 [Colletotrichum orchidophilum]|uniref:Uncharacterized protein n=1 Tax=Colletotrichum orchidophilum TaxID=1209926 RepID=A0A1G4AZU5_9PEZI|nr:uncharacterized protein CORC01_10068 [Colletotrichum orchidophilum]OHE94667.1 hypothetical protein CORC01_10068 [Colletotrichum orchidophilum]